MNNEEIIQKYLLSGNEYERYALLQIIETLKIDFKKLYESPDEKIEANVKTFKKKHPEISILIDEYVSGLDDTNVGEILLFLNSLPAIAKEIQKDTEKGLKDVGGISKLVSRDKTNSYMKNVFGIGYDTLYKNVNNNQIGMNMYYECEKFIDSLVLEFKQNIAPMCILRKKRG